MRYVLGLGTNIGNREQNLRDAIAAPEHIPETVILRQSAVYETEPYGYAQQDRFLNMAVLLESAFPPEAMLGACLGIEAGLGRVRLFKNGPRIIDLDVLLAEGFTADTPILRVPHPEIRKRAFVLQPLMDLFPQGEAFGYTFLDAYRACTLYDIKKHLAAL